MGDSKRVSFVEIQYKARTRVGRSANRMKVADIPENVDTQQSVMATEDQNEDGKQEEGKTEDEAGRDQTEDAELKAAQEAERLA